MNIKSIVKSDAAYEILDRSNSAGSTWTSGGCAILAKALNILYNYRIYVIYNRNFNSPEHFGVMTPTGSIIDADGEHSSEDDWLLFFKENEMPRQGELVVYPYASGMNMGEIHFDQKASEELAELIRNYTSIIKEVRGILKENIQLADKVYFNSGKLSPKVREIITTKITNGDPYTKIITDIYYAMLQDSHAVGDWAVRSLDDPNAEIDRTDKKIENDVLGIDDWKKVKSYYQQLKTYNKNVFPIEGYNPNGVKDIWNLIIALNERAKILEDIKKLPAIAIRNMRGDFRQERDSSDMQAYRIGLNDFLAYYSLLGNRDARLRKTIENKMFIADVTLEDLLRFVEEKENLVGGAKFTKNSIKKLVMDNDYDMEIVYENGNVMVVDVTSPDGIKKVGCNSLWCFTYGKGFDSAWRDWNNYSTNDHVYVIVDFSEQPDSPEFMHVLIKPLDYRLKPGDDDDVNDNKLFNMANEESYNAIGIVNHLVGEQAPFILHFDEPTDVEGPSSKYPYEDPNQLKLDLQEVRKIVRYILKENSTNGNENKENFNSWFSGSKVVDSSGNPLVVHHGTSKKFSKFNIKKSTQGLIWFTSNKGSVEAGEVGAQGRGYIMDLYAVIKNPAGWDEYDKYTLGQLENMGYDGAILPDSDGSITGFVFSPGQLKSVSNKGEWSKSNDNIFKEVIEEEIIDETYKGQKDLEKLTKDILFLLAKGIIKEKNHMVFLTDNPEEPITSIPLANTLMMNGEGFVEIAEFVESTNIQIAATTGNIRGRQSVQGELEYGYPNQFGESYFKIWLKYKKESLDEINEMFSLYDTVEENDVYFKLFYMFYSTLLHELQHAYDAWRSNGKAFSGQMSKKFIDSKAKADAIASSKSSEDLTPEEIEAIQNSHKAYLNLVHEINARFAQALQKTSITSVNLDTYDDEMKPWDKVFSAFKVNFTGWNILSNKMKRKLIRRLSKAYYERSQTLKKGEDRVREYEKEMESEKEQGKKSIAETRDIIREVLLEQKSERLLNEAISIFEEEGDSPTFEWDVAQEKLDQSIENIFTGTQAKEYLIKFLNRIQSLPRQIKIRLAKYVATSLIGLIGIGTISSVFSGQASDIQKEVVSSIQKEVNKSEFKAPKNISNELIEFLKGEEGIGGKPVLTAYDIGDGAYTIGYGHAIFRNPNRGSTGGDYEFLPHYKNITPGKTRITPQQAETLLRDDVNEAKVILDDILNNWKEQGIRVEIDQQMYDAMVSMIYNMGREKFATSEFIQHVKKGDFKSAAESIDKIDAPALLKKFPGLLNRRAGEKQIFSMNLDIPYEVSESIIAEGLNPSEFTVAYFQKRIPFLKGYDIDYSPGSLSYQHGMDDRIQMSKTAMSKDVTIPFGDELVTFPSVYISSSFFYYPHKIDENIFYVLGLKNKFSFMEPSNMTPLQFRVFNTAIHAKQEKEFSSIHEIMVHDGQEIPEAEINAAINDINKKMFNLEDEISAWQIENLF